MEEYAICAGVAISVFCFVYWLYLLRSERPARGALVDGERSGVDSLAVRALLPYARSIGSVVAKKAADVEMQGRPHGYGALLLAARRKILRSIFAAGNPGGMTPDEFIGLVVVGTIVGVAGGLLVGLAAKKWLVFLVIACGALGLSLPLSWLRKQALKRTKAIRKALPYALDLLTLAVGSGMDFSEAMMRLARKLGDNPLGRELSMTVRSIQLGRSRADALRDLSWRVGMVEMSSVTGSIIQADELGASLGPILRIQAEQIRMRRFHHAEEQAMKAPVKIIFPLALCILPTTLMIIFGSLAIPHLGKIAPLLSGRLGLG